MLEVLPIYAAALLLGLISGVAAVHLLTTRMGRLSLRALLAIVALAALLSSLFAAKPENWSFTASLWAMSALVMALADLAVVGLVDPCRSTRRFSERSARRLILWLPPGIAGAIVGVLTVLKLCWDIPLNVDYLPSFAASLIIAILAMTLVDLAARLVGIRWSRWRRLMFAQASSRSAGSL